MSAEAASRQDACREYQSSLEDLTFNSKPHINMLTILAEENLQFSTDIVAIIEAQIAKVFIKIRFILCCCAAAMLSSSSARARAHLRHLRLRPFNLNTR